MSIIHPWRALACCALLFALGGALPARAATIRGVVTFAGAVESKKLPVTIDQYVCGKEKDAEDLVVGRDRGVRHVVVWLQTPPAGGTWERPPGKVDMDQQGCAFVPHVVIVPTGGTVEFLNS